MTAEDTVLYGENCTTFALKVRKKEMATFSEAQRKANQKRPGRLGCPVNPRG
jgi:hypothetical protein